MKRGPRPVSAEKRFWRFVKKTAKCWLWTGCITENGYGQFGTAGTKHEQAHRFAYKIYHGRLPKRKVLHTCDIRHCVRKAHLFIGTSAQNTKDMMERGRCRWEGAGYPKLSPHQRRAVTRLVRCGVSKRSLARKMGVSWATIDYWGRR